MYSLGVSFLQHPIELVQVSVGRLALDGGVEVGQQPRGVQLGRLGAGLPDLQVRLPVQVRRLDERYALRFTGDKQVF